MYFCSKTGNGVPDFSTDDFSKTFDICLVGGMPKDNAIFLDGQLYDNRELDYLKLARTKENQVIASKILHIPLAYHHMRLR